MAVANEAPCSWLGYGVWSTPRTCFISSFWDVANPRTTKPVSNNLFTFLFARFSQSDLLLTSSDGTVASSKDVERILLHCISRLVIQYYGTVASSKDVERILLHCLSRLVIHYFLSVFYGLFCARAMHSTTKFAMMFLSKCEQTLGACLLAQCLLAHHQVLVQKRLTLGLIDSEHICPKRAYSQQIRRKYTVTLHERETQQEPLPWDPKRPNDPRWKDAKRCAKARAWNGLEMLGNYKHLQASWGTVWDAETSKLRLNLLAACVLSSCRCLKIPLQTCLEGIFLGCFCCTNRL